MDSEMAFGLMMFKLGTARQATKEQLPTIELAIRLSRLFDEVWYLKTNPDVAASGMDPLSHYLKDGAADGRDPSPRFDTKFYVSMNPDVLRRGVNPLVDYIVRCAARFRTGEMTRTPVGAGETPLLKYGNMRDQYDFIAASRVFDAPWYLDQNPDVAADGRDPVWHYLEHGAAEGRDPGPTFSTRRYLVGKPLVRAQGFNPLLHFLSASNPAELLGHDGSSDVHGSDQEWHDIVSGRAHDAVKTSGLFDAAFYLDKNSDVAASGMDPLSHYLIYGAAEGRNPSPRFASQWYLHAYPDVAEAGVYPLLHYIKHGAREGRDPHPVIRSQRACPMRMSEISVILESKIFDSVWYLSHNAIAGLDPEFAFQHYITKGARDGLDPCPLFSTVWYLECNPDVAAASVNPLAHYLVSGASEGRDPSPDFNTIWYDETYPDVGLSRQNALVHYLSVGMKEGRSIRSAVADPYERWMSLRTVGANERSRQVANTARMPLNPRFSVLMPTYKSDLDLVGLAIDSVERQTYANWELCIVDDGSGSSELSAFLRSRADREPRIKLVLLEKNVGISAATNRALQEAVGEFIALFDHDDELAPHALYAMADAVNRHPDADMLYSDEDKVGINGVRFGPFFKPDWSPEFMLSCMYTCHLGVYRRQLAIDVGSFRTEFDFAQDYDLALRVSARARRIVHVPDILYHWRITENSTAGGAQAKPLAELSARRAIQAAVDSEGLRGTVIEGPFRGSHRVVLDIGREPLVSVVIPTAARRSGAARPSWYLLDLLRSCQANTYRNLEYVIVHNGDMEQILENFISDLGLPIKYVHYAEPVFNIASKMNLGVSEASGEYVVILNDDMTVITSNWIEEMLMWFSRSGVVGVGGRLLFPNDTVQHAGVLLLGQGPSHVYYGAESSNYGLAGSAVLCRNYTAVTGACMMVRRADYLKVAGFDPFFRINYNDVDFCMRLGKLGRIVYTPYAELYHHEAVSKDEASPDELRAFNERWADVIGSDPFYNRNLSQSSAFNAVSRKVRSLATDYPDYEEPSHRDTKTEKARSAPNIV